MSSDDDNNEMIDGESSTRWQKIKEHRLFKPALAVGSAVVIGGIAFVAAKSPATSETVKALIVDGLLAVAPEADHAASEASKRKPPAEHPVGGHQRNQRFGPGRAETKVVEIGPYTRGG